MSILEHMKQFADRYAKKIVIHDRTWQYYRLGTGSPILWLTGGLRRVAPGFNFMERLAARHTVIAPDYPPVDTIGEYIDAFDAILLNEGIETVTLGGQSYGGILAQAYLAQRGKIIERLILSSSGPADYGKAWLPVEYLCIGLVRILPEKTVKQILTGGLLRFISMPEAERLEWREAITYIMQSELTRHDVVSHFAVAADLIRRGIVTPVAFQNWRGRILILSSENDPTQSKKDIPHYERLFGRAVEVINMGNMGHTAALFNPDRYIELLEGALG